MSFGDPLLSLAIVLTAGIIGGELLGYLHLPKVTGWIGTGIALRAAGIPGLGPGELGSFSPFTDFVLGFIAFTVGATLHVASLRNMGKRLSLLLLGEMLVTPTVVFFALYIAGLDFQTALIMSAIAIAGAPGTTVLVVREARARGNLTRTLIAAVGLIDMVAVGVFAFVSSMMGDAPGEMREWHDGLAALGTEFGLTIAVGFGCAATALILTRRIVGPAFLGPIMVAVILGSWGMAKGLGVSSILACTFAGIALSNLRHETARSTEAYLTPFGGVLFAGFYTLAGMRLDFNSVLPLAGLVAVYFLGRLTGKAVAAYFSMRVSGATGRLRRYLGIALLPHGGVAVGLILFVQGSTQLAWMADTVLALGLATLAINQLIGPSATRFALSRTGEVGQDRPRLLDFLTEPRIVTGIEGGTKEELIERLAGVLYATTPMPLPKDKFVAQVLERESEGSTCLGEGLMIPHAMLDEGNDVRGVLGLSTKGLDLDASDGHPVHAIVLLATPREGREHHLEVLAAFANALTGDDNIKEQLYHARSAAHAWDILHADDDGDINYFLDDALQSSAMTEDAAEEN